MSQHPLDPIFHPRAVAVVGVSDAPGSRGARFHRSLLEGGFPPDRIYPINPRLSESSGVRCYPTLLDAPDPVDHVISCVPAAAVPGLVDHCVEKGVRSIHFFTAGFSETGDEEMAEVEREMIARLQAAGIRAIGPNCLGLYVPESGLSFSEGFPTEAGEVFLLSQSGANASGIVSELAERGVRFSKVVSFGNGADVRAETLIDYAASDPASTTVMAYLEGVHDGRALFDALKRCAAVKPTIILKGGLTGAGARAAASHTGSLAGSTEVFEALCRQTGAIRAETMEDLLDLVVAVSTSAAKVRGPRVALLAGGGGFAVLSADALAAEGLDLPPMPEAAVQEMREFIPVAGSSVNNPLDAGAPDAEGNERMLRIVATTGEFDVVLVTGIGGMGFGGLQAIMQGGGEVNAEEVERALVDGSRESAAMLARLQEETGVPFVSADRSSGMARRMASMMGAGLEIDAEKAGAAFQQAATEHGLSVLPDLQRAARVLGLLLEWRQRREGLPALF